MPVLADLFSDPLPGWIVIVLELPGLLMLISVVVYLVYARLNGGDRK